METKKSKIYYYLLVLLIIVTILFVLLYSYIYTKHYNAFNNENVNTTQLIADNIDRTISRLNTDLIKLSSLPEMKSALITEKGVSILDIQKIFDVIQENMENNNILDSIYVYFSKSGQVLTNQTLYSIEDFYEKEFLMEVFRNAFGNNWFNFRKISSDLYTYIKPSYVITLIRKFPPLEDSSNVFIVGNIDQNLLLSRFSTYKKYNGIISIIHENNIAASENEELIFKSLNESYPGIEFNNKAGTIEYGALNIYYAKSGISNLIYTNSIEKSVFSDTFKPYKYVLLSMYVTSLLALIFVSYLVAKFFRGRFVYFIKKLDTQSDSLSGLRQRDEFVALDKAIDDIVVRNKAIEERVKIYNQIVKNMLVLKIFTGITISDKELSKQIEYLNINFEYPYYTPVISMVIDSENDELNKDDLINNRNIIIIKEILDNELAQSFKVYSALLDNEKIGIIVNHSKQDVKAELSNILKKINKSIQQEYNVYLLFSIGNSVSNIDDISKSYYNARENLNLKGICDSDMVIMDFDQEERPLAFPIAIQNKIINGFRNNSKQIIKDGIDSFFNEYLKDGKYSLNNIKNVAIVLFCNTIKTLWENDFNVQIEDSFDIINSITEKNSAKELNEYLNEFFVNILEKQDVFVESNNAVCLEYITKVVSFMNENYSKDLSISDIARSVNLNPRYLGSLFKNATGKTLIEYLNEIRIKKAKELLSQTNMSIKTISESVGYNDVHTFIRNFKKLFNITPSEYRISVKN